MDEGRTPIALLQDFRPLFSILLRRGGPIRAIALFYIHRHRVHNEDAFGSNGRILSNRRSQVLGHQLDISRRKDRLCSDVWIRWSVARIEMNVVNAFDGISRRGV